LTLKASEFGVNDNRLFKWMRPGRAKAASPGLLHWTVFLTPAQLAMLLEGIDWRQSRHIIPLLTML